MKRYVALFLSLSLVVALVGCSQTASKEEPAKREDGVLIELSDSGISVNGEAVPMTPQLPFILPVTSFITKKARISLMVKERLRTLTAPKRQLPILLSISRSPVATFSAVLSLPGRWL